MSDGVIVHTYLLGPDGGATSADRIADALAAPECAWVHLDGTAPSTAEWIATHLHYLPDVAHAALIDPQTRPRIVRLNDGVLLNLRGVNLNPGAEPEDMISVRIYADPARIVSVTLRPLRSIGEIAELIETGEGPTTTGAFLATLAEVLEEKIEAAVLTFDAEADRIEDALFDGADAGLRPAISDLRQALAEFRRFIGPQQSAVERLLTSAPAGVLDETDKLRLAGVDDDLRRDAEIIQSLTDRLIAMKDELQHLSDARLNRNLYILSVVSAVFLPLGFLTGLMGINLAGMPGASWPPAFWVFTGALALLAALVGVVLWKLRVVRTRR